MSSLPPDTATPLPTDLPDDHDVPNNYVSHTLKTQKALPPITWDNFLTELNWLNVGILTLTPFVGAIGAFTTKLRWETALFAVLYYYVTGLGVPYFFVYAASFILTYRCRHNSRLPPPMGPPFIQRL
jgi:stearoyl-CoA desaturase (Delta-9 desaturase)